MCFQCEETMRPTSELSPVLRGRPVGKKSIRMAVYGDRYGVSWRVVRRVGLEQLIRCKDDDARRVLLNAVNRRR
jgi:predicted 3-demethylubiquinone-9 3-methyltransferase (glyoxalase superfamily)